MLPPMPGAERRPEDDTDEEEEEDENPEKLKKSKTKPSGPKVWNTSLSVLLLEEKNFWGGKLKDAYTIDAIKYCLRKFVKAVSVNVLFIPVRWLSMISYVCLWDQVWIFGVWHLVSQQKMSSVSLRLCIAKCFAISTISFTLIFLGSRSICFGWHRIHDVASFCCYRSLHSTPFLSLQVITSRQNRHFFIISIHSQQHLPTTHTLAQH